MRWTRQRRLRRCDGRAGFQLVSDRRRGRRTAIATYSKAVWSWHPLLVSSRRRCCEPNRARKAVNSPMTVTRRIRRRGERGISCKTIAQGMPECSVCTCMLVCVFDAHFCTRDRGCSKHPAFPAPSSFLGETILQSPGERAAGMRRCVCVGWVEHSETHRLAYRHDGYRFAPPILRTCGPMDCFASLAMTALRGCDGDAAPDSGFDALHRPGMTVLATPR